MKNFGIPAFYFALLTMVGMVSAGEEVTSAPAPQPQLQPIELSVLLKILPDCPADWTLKRS
jgi:hypothetical protein